MEEMIDEYQEKLKVNLWLLLVRFLEQAFRNAERKLPKFVILFISRFFSSN